MKFNKKYLCFVLSLVLILTSIWIPMVISAVSTSEAVFKTQHTVVDFSKYNIVDYATTSSGNNVYMNASGPSFSIENETVGEEENAYLQVTKTAQQKANWEPHHSIIINPTGSTVWDEHYRIQQNGKYRLTFKYKLTKEETTSWTGVYLRTRASADLNLKNSYNKLNGSTNLSSTYLAPTETWTEKTVEFSMDTFAWSGCASSLAFFVSTNGVYNFGYTLSIDDVTIDRLGSVTLHDVAGQETIVYGVPATTVYNKYNNANTTCEAETIVFPDAEPAQWYSDTAGETLASGTTFNATTDRHFYAVVKSVAPWDGLVAENYAGGDGSKGNPYQIATAGQLAKLAQSASANNHYSNPENYTGGKYYVLTADIDLNDTTNADWYNSANLQEWKYYVTSADYAFCGYLNGQGHTIKGLYINQDEIENKLSGLFGALGKGAVIENVKIAKSYIKAKYASAIAGGLCNNIADSTEQPIIRRCYIDDSVIVNGSVAAGIIASSGKMASIESCYVGANITATNKRGSFLGDTWSPGSFTVKDSYAAHSDTTLSPYAGVGVSATNSYTTAANKGGFVNFVNADSSGDNAKTTMSKLNYDDVWVTVEGMLPQLRFFHIAYSAVENEKLNTPTIPEKEYYGPWNGKAATSFAGGNGTKDDPYRISTPEQLAYLVQITMNSYWDYYPTKNKYYILTNDIVINDTTKSDWKEHAREWITTTVDPFGNDCHSKAFAGCLDGAGHVIKGLYANGAEEKSGAGLFVSVTQNAVIKNIGIEDSYLKADLVGAFAMRDNNHKNSTPSFIACYVDDSVELVSCRTAEKGQGWVGGLIGYSQREVNIKFCYVKAKIAGYVKNNVKQYGAFYGNMSNNSYITILGSYTACPDGVPIIGPRSGVGIFVASTYSSNNKDDNSKVILTGVPMYTVERMTGHEAALEENMANFNFNDVWYTVENDTPKLRVFLDDFTGPDPETVKDPSELTVYNDAKPGDVWKPNTIASEFAGGTGTEQDPYQIATAEQLAFFLRDAIEKSAWDNYRSKDKYYIVTSDIYLNDVSDKNWRKNNPAEWFISSATQGQCFAGNLDGGGHVVYGLYINSEDKAYASLLGAIGGNAVVKNLGLADSYIYGGDKYVGGFFSYVENRAWTKYKEPIISNCFVAEDVYLSGGCTGGIVAANATTITIKNCYSLATVEGTATRFGGIIGYQWYNGIYKDQDDSNKIATTNIINCYVNEPSKIPVIGTLTYLDYVEGENVYSLNGKTPNVSSVISFGNMCGDKAKEYFKGFDFENTWVTVDKSTPVLKVFKNVKHKYDEHFYRTKGPVTVSFETYGGTEIASLVGETGEKLTLPTKVSRGIDVFDGWYVYPTQTWDVPFDFDYFPDDDITLYAKWIVKGSNQDFENYPYTDAGIDGMDYDYELFRLGVAGYKMDYVYEGAKSLHRLGISSDVQVASLADSKTVKLVKGGEYELTAWVYVKSKGENIEPDKLMIAYLPHYDWAYEVTGLESITDMSKLSVGNWQKVTCKFIATEEYIGIATPGNTELFIDDITITPTGKTGLKNRELLELYSETVVEETVTLEVPVEEQDDADNDNKPTSTRKKVVIKRRKINKFGIEEILLISGAVIAIAAVTVLSVIIIKKKKARSK